MQEYEYGKPFVGVIVAGALIGVAKLLVSHEPLSFRVIAGRAILGSASSMVAGLVLLQIPHIDPIALVGLGSAFGIVGSQYIEKFIKSRMPLKVEEEKADE